MKLYAPPLSSVQRSTQSILNAIIWCSTRTFTLQRLAKFTQLADPLETVWICRHLLIWLITFNLLIKAEKMEFTAAFKSGDNHTIDGVVCVYSTARDLKWFPFTGLA